MRSIAFTALVAVALVVAPGCKKKSRSNPVPTPPPLTSPTVTGVTPPDGDVAGGTSITIQGTDFVTGAQVTIGGSLCTGVSVASATSITATTPAGSVGGATVIVTNPDNQTASLVNGFTYTSSGGNNAPTFSSVNPSTGSTAGGTTITITGTGFYTGATVTVGGVAATNVVVVSGTSITCQTPAGMGTSHDVVVTNADAQAATGTGAFSYLAPSITSFTPNSGPQAGGGTITIAGANFGTLSSVTFNGVSATVTLQSQTSLEVTLPASSTSGAATVVVTVSGQTGTDTTGFTYNPPPTVTSVSPADGPLAGGVTVTVTGSNFVSGVGLGVTFGGNPATSVVWQSATTITCATPSGTGTVNVVVTNPDTQTGTGTGLYTYNPLPTISSIVPSTGPTAGGNTVTINGTNFLNGPNPTVTFGGSLATVTNFSTTALEVTAPSGSAGAVNVVVTNRDGQAATSTGGYTYSNTPTLSVTNVTPGSGTTNGGTPLTITGTGFGIGATVTIGSNACGNVIVVSATTITCTSPAGTGTGLTVTVTSGGNNANWGSTWNYTSTGTVPSISALSPTGGPAAGGTVVTVSGSNFGTSPQVTIDGVSAVVSGSSASSITITAPAALHSTTGGAKNVFVTDTTTGETSSGFSGYTYTPDSMESLTIDLGLPDVAIDGSGNIHVVFQTNPTSGNNDIQYRTSSDGGKNWGVGSITSGRVTQTTNNSTWARIAAQGSTVFIVWQEAASPTTIDYIYTTNGGTSWSSTASLPNGTGTQANVQGSPDVAIDANGRVYVTWTELGNVGPWGTDIDVWVVSGTPSGIGSATPVQLSGGGDFCTAPSVDADGNGVALVAWDWTPNASVVSINRGLDYSRTTNSGTAWSTASTLQGATAIATSAGVAIFGSDVVVTFVEGVLGTPTTYAVKSYYSTDTGANFSAGGTLRSSSSTVITSAAVTVDASGFFMAVWSEVGGSQTDVFAAFSSDAGQNWSTGVAFANTGNASTSPRVAAGAAGNWSVAWCEYNSGISGNDIVHW